MFHFLKSVSILSKVQSYCDSNESSAFTTIFQFFASKSCPSYSSPLSSIIDKNLYESLKTTSNIESVFEDDDRIDRMAPCYKLPEKIRPFLLDFESDVMTEKMLDEFRSSSVIGLDTEFYCGQFCKISNPSLIQLSTEKAVLLIDCCTLSHEYIIRLFSSIFSSPKLILAYGVAQDRDLFKFYIPNESIYSSISWLDLALIENKVIQFLPSEFDHSSYENSTNKGLARFTESILGLPLDKTECWSDWSFRPLRSKQLIYAALDAYVLVQIWSKLSKYQSVFDSLGQKSVNTREKLLPQAPIRNPETEIIKTIIKNSRNRNEKFQNRPRDFKFLAAESLTGLGRQLRILGFDVLLISNDVSLENVDNFCQKAVNEARVILCQGKTTQDCKKCIVHLIKDDKTVNDYIMPFNIVSKKAVDMAIEFAEKLAVDIRKEDIFSRCQICNFHSFVIVETNDMLKVIRNIFDDSILEFRREYLDTWVPLAQSSPSKKKTGHFNQFLVSALNQGGVDIGKKDLDFTEKSFPTG